MQSTYSGGTLLHPAPLVPLGGEPTMAQDSLVSPAQPMGGEQSSTDPKLWPEHQRLFFHAEERERVLL